MTTSAELAGRARAKKQLRRLTELEAQVETLTQSEQSLKRRITELEAQAQKLEEREKRREETLDQLRRKGKGLELTLGRLRRNIEAEVDKRLDGIGDQFAALCGELRFSTLPLRLQLDIEALAEQLDVSLSRAPH